MPKKTLITKLSTNVTDFSTEQIDAYKAFMKASFAPGGFSAIDFEVVEESKESLSDFFATLMRSVQSEFKASDAAPRIRFESNGEVLGFDVNKVDDERPCD